MAKFPEFVVFEIHPVQPLNISITESANSKTRASIAIAEEPYHFYNL